MIVRTSRPSARLLRCCAAEESGQVVRKLHEGRCGGRRFHVHNHIESKGFETGWTARRAEDLSRPAFESVSNMRFARLFRDGHSKAGMGEVTRSKKKHGEPSCFLRPRLVDLEKLPSPGNSAGPREALPRGSGNIALHVIRRSDPARRAGNEWADPFLTRAGGGPGRGSPSGQTARRLRPLRRRAERTALPVRVRIRTRKPCVRLRRRLFG